jgi:hypothetical protein
MTIGWLLYQVLRPVERSLPTSTYMSMGSSHSIVAFKTGVTTREDSNFDIFDSHCSLAERNE